IANEAIKLLVTLNMGARRDFTAAVKVECLLPEDLAREADAMAKVCPIVGMGHIIEADDRRFPRIRRSKRDVTARFRSHGPRMSLEAMCLGGRLAIISDCNRDEVVLDIRIVDAGCRA